MESDVCVRRKTPTVNVGGVLVGSEHPVVVQSMTNTDTEDIRSTATQIAELARAGSELVRITVNTENAAATATRRIPRHGAVGQRQRCAGVDAAPAFVRAIARHGAVGHR